MSGMDMLTSQLEPPHGFMTRSGGLSEAHFASLNLGLSTGDDPEKVARNRQLVLDAFGVSQDEVCALQQVHSAHVVEAEPSWFELEADASVTNDPSLLLVISTADCLPILFYDPAVRSIGAAHAGWRGTLGGIVSGVVARLGELYGSRPENLQVAFGPAIAGACYQVGPEVKAAFSEAGFPSDICRPDDEGRYRLDIAKANRYLLERAGVRPESISQIAACTHCDQDRFYSHRRDGLKRGSHWAVIKLKGKRS